MESCFNCTQSWFKREMDM